MKNKYDWSIVVAYITDEMFFSQRELSEYCNVTQQTISNWKSKVRSPGALAKEKLLEILQNGGVSTEAFRKGYSANYQNTTDITLRELVDLYNNIPPESKTNLLEFARFQRCRKI